MTGAERLLWSKLRAGQTGVKWRRQVPVGPYVVDFLCKSAALVVEVDGGQHDEESDDERSAFLERRGLRVVRFWNTDVLSNIDGVMETMMSETKRPHPVPPQQAGEGTPAATGPLRATDLTHSHDDPADTLTLAYDDRYRRRMSMCSDDGLAFLLDLPEATDMRPGDSLVLEDGRLIRIVAADEPLMEAVPGDLDDLPRVAWHVGNRHLTCQILADRLVLRADKVIAHMLEHLGCSVSFRDGPFTPEGGAYGQGRTHSHEH